MLRRAGICTRVNQAIHCGEGEEAEGILIIMYQGSSLCTPLPLMVRVPVISQAILHYTHPPLGMNLKDPFIEGDIRCCIAIFIKSLIPTGNKAPGILETKLMY